MNLSQNPSALRSKAEITNALLKLMQQFPYEEITVKEILFEAKVARKTFYRNFDNKADVLSAYIDNIMLRYVSTLQRIEVLTLSAVLDVIFDFCYINRSFLMLLRDNHLLYFLVNKLNEFIPRVHNEIAEADCPIFRYFNSVQTEYIISLNIGLVWNIIVKWVERDMEESPEMIKTTILDYISKIVNLT